MNCLSQTTNLGVRSSNLFGRAISILDNSGQKSNFGQLLP